MSVTAVPKIDYRKNAAEEGRLMTRDEWDMQPHNMSHFGYQGYCVEFSIALDNPKFLTECRDKGFIDRDTKCLDNTTLHDRCVYKGAKTCAALLEKWGWT